MLREQTEGGEKSGLRRSLNQDPRQILGLQFFAEEGAMALSPQPVRMQRGRAEGGARGCFLLLQAASARHQARTITGRFVLRVEKLPGRLSWRPSTRDFKSES